MLQLRETAGAGMACVYFLRALPAEGSNERVHPKTEQAEYSPEDETKNQIQEYEDGIHVAFPPLSFGASLTPTRVTSFYHRRPFYATCRRFQAKTGG
ncbi:MAG TPA: hypothetical protein VMZ06_04685 [Candidatus Bathyarchaeia archaeon]|nr:hypothetical protein [Candidatus Bathyarchaeia archaeon]